MQNGKNIKFKQLLLPTGDIGVIPDDLTINFPFAPGVSTDKLHYLANIPWDERYLTYVPPEYRDFFVKMVLPRLHVRTSDVHTALSLSALPTMLEHIGQPLNKQVACLALMLHDCGWSEVSPQGIVDSLSADGATPTDSPNLKPRQQHLIFGESLAYKLLDDYDFGMNGPSDEEKYIIAEIIRRQEHDAPWEQGKYAGVSPELFIVCDCDRLWLYSYENFWLDTIRLNIPPETYIEAITSAVNLHFLTEPAKALAQMLLDQRKPEVAAYLAAKASPNNIRPHTGTTVAANPNPAAPTIPIVPAPGRQADQYAQQLMQNRNMHSPNNRGRF